MTYIFLIAALLIRPHRASFTFVFAATIFNMVLGDTDGYWYFPLAAFCDFIVTGLLFHFRIDRKVLDMMAVSVASLSLNLLGWVMWYLYEPPDVYVFLFSLLYAMTTVLILRKDGTNVGGAKFHIDYACNHPHVDSGYRVCYQGKRIL